MTDAGAPLSFDTLHRSHRAHAASPTATAAVDVGDNFFVNSADRLHGKLARLDFKRLVASNPEWSVLEVDRLLPAGSKLLPGESKYLTRAIDHLVFRKASERNPPLFDQGVLVVKQRILAMVRDGANLQSKFDILQGLVASRETASPRVITTAANALGMSPLETYGPGQPASAFIDGKPRLG